MNRELWNQAAGWDGITRFYGVEVDDLLLSPGMACLDLVRSFNPRNDCHFSFNPSDLLKVLCGTPTLERIIASSDDGRLKERATATLRVRRLAEREESLRIVPFHCTRTNERR